MSNGEVKRFKFINGVGNWSREDAVLASDHERVVAELKAALLKCVEALEKIANQASLEAEGDQYAANSYEHIRATAVHHLADLRKAVEECK